MEVRRAVTLTRREGRTTLKVAARSALSSSVAKPGDEGASRRNLVHLGVAHLTCRDGRSRRLLVLLEVLRHSRSGGGSKDGCNKYGFHG